MKRLTIAFLVVAFLGCGTSPKRKLVDYWYRNWAKFEKPIPAIPGYKQRGLASWYGAEFHGKKTASGEPYNMFDFTAAHKSLPLGTYVRVKNLKNGRTVVVRINDRGPYIPGRIIDLSYAAARALGMVEDGVVPVEITVLGRFPRGSVAKLVRGRFYVQVGAFVNQKNAFNLMARLARMGYPSFIRKKYVKGKLFYRVLVGPYYFEREAERVAWALKSLFPARVVSD